LADLISRSKGRSLAGQVALLVLITALFTQVLGALVVLLLPSAPVGVTLEEALRRTAPVLRALDMGAPDAAALLKRKDGVLAFSLATAPPRPLTSPVYKAFDAAAGRLLRIDPARIRVVERRGLLSPRLPPPPGDIAIGASGRTIRADSAFVEQSTTGQLILMAAPRALAIQTRAGWLVVQDAERGEFYWLRHAVPTVLLTFAVLLPIVAWQSRLISNQIKRFAAAVETIGGAADADRLQEPRIMELQPAVRAFNNMKDRISQLNNNRVMMMAAVSHDIRTPLARMRFRVASLDPAIRDGISRDIVQIDKFIDEILAMTRNAASPTSQSAFDLSALVQSAVDELSDSGADVRFDGPANLPIQADLPAVRRIINNLLDNALKYGTSARVTLSARAGRSEILVEDDGPGIPAAARAAIFEPFLRLEPSRNRSTGGSGLGLAIARHLARLQMGDVELTGGRGQGRGARFLFWLPCGTETPAPEERAASSDRALVNQI
jgi:two-component system OmpR family sensor kinase